MSSDLSPHLNVSISQFPNSALGYLRMLLGTVVVVQFAECPLSIQEDLGGFPPQYPRSSVSALNRKRSKVKIRLSLRVVWDRKHSENASKTFYPRF